MNERAPDGSRIDLYWLPLGAGDALPIVRWNGRLYEAVAARRERRPSSSLYHAALEITVEGRRYVIEMAPAWSGADASRGVVGQGPVGFRWLGRSRFFRYEVRRWPDGRIPDIRHAVGGAQRLASDADTAARVLSLVPSFPTATWGRDEHHVGDMWNSNSLIAWLLVRGGVDVGSTRPPDNGRAPGWSAGLAVAAR